INVKHKGGLKLQLQMGTEEVKAVEEDGIENTVFEVKAIIEIMELRGYVEGSLFVKLYEL
ncbi:16257_t:CDS:1, partial [Funneliformis caledonium]